MFSPTLIISCLDTLKPVDFEVVRPPARVTKLHNQQPPATELYTPAAMTELQNLIAQATTTPATPLPTPAAVTELQNLIAQATPLPTPTAVTNLQNLIAQATTPVTPLPTPAAVTELHTAAAVTELHTATPVTELQIAQAIREQGGAIADAAEEIARIVHANECDTVGSLLDTEPSDLVEILTLAGLGCTTKRAKRVLQGFATLVSTMRREAAAVSVLRAHRVQPGLLEGELVPSSGGLVPVAASHSAPAEHTPLPAGAHSMLQAVAPEILVPAAVEPNSQCGTAVTGDIMEAPEEAPGMQSADVESAERVTAALNEEAVHQADAVQEPVCRKAAHKKKRKKKVTAQTKETEEEGRQHSDVQPIRVSQQQMM